MELNRHNMQKLALLIIFSIVVYLCLRQIGLVIATVFYILNLLLPFILGGAIAFILNVPMRWLEGKLFSSQVKKKFPRFYRFHRVLSLVLTFVLVIGILAVLGLMVFPEIGQSLLTVGERIRIFSARFIMWLQELAVSYPEAVNQILEYAQNWTTIDWQEIGKNILQFLQSGNILGGTFAVAGSIIGGVANFFIGIIFAIYILLQKEKLTTQIKKVMYSFLPEDVADYIIRILRLTNSTFSHFISGQCLEACILGGLFFVVMTVLRLPYALVISMLIGVTALIPIFGAFIGCVVGAFLILIVNPMQALVFIIVFLILQQVEGNLIYPHVVGNSVGLPSIWVLLAVTIGGSTMGIIGMIIYIPLFSVLYSLLRESVYRRLKSRKIAKEKLE